MAEDKLKMDEDSHNIAENSPCMGQINLFLGYERGAR